MMKVFITKYDLFLISHMFCVLNCVLQNARFKDSILMQEIRLERRTQKIK